MASPVRYAIVRYKFITDTVHQKKKFITRKTGRWIVVAGGPIRKGEFSTPKVRDSCYFCLIFPFFNENFWILQERLIQLRGASGIFFRIFGSHPSSGTRFFAGETWFIWHCSNYETRNSGPPRTRNLTFNSPIDRSQWEKYVKFFFRILPPYPSPETTFRVRKTRLKRAKMSQKTRFQAF